MKEILDAMKTFETSFDNSTSEKFAELVYSLWENDSLNEFMPSQLQRDAFEAGLPIS